MAVPADRPADPVFPLVGWQRTPSTYGPAFTLATFPLGRLPVPVALWAMKVLSALAVLALAAVTASVARRRGMCPARAATLVALNPLVLVHVVGGAHNDGLLALGLMLSVASMLRKGGPATGAWLVAAIGVKVSAAFAGPFLLLGAARPRRALAGFALAATGLLGLSWALFGAHAADPFRMIGRNQAAASHDSVPATLSRLTGLPPTLVRAGAVVLLAWFSVHLLWRTARGVDPVDAAAWAGVGLLLTTSRLLPWYVIWVLPVAAVARDRRTAGWLLVLCGFLLASRVPI